MLAVSGVNLRANNYFWGVCIAVGALALLAISRPALADETDPDKTTSGADAARLEAEIQSLHDELASTKELLRQATSSGDELLLAQRGDGPARANNAPSDPPAKGSAISTDDKKLDTDAWQSLDKELAGRRPGMRDGFRGGPPPWARHSFHGGPPWMHPHRHGGGPAWAHHHHHGHHGWARHGRHRHWAHHHHHRGNGRGGPAWARHHHHGRHDGRSGGAPWQHDGWAHRGPEGFGPGPRGPRDGDGMMRINERLDMLERKIDALMHEVRGTHEGPDRGGPMRDGPPHDGPPRDGPPRDGPPRDAAPPRKPGD